MFLIANWIWQQPVRGIVAIIHVLFDVKTCSSHRYSRFRYLFCVSSRCVWGYVHLRGNKEMIYRCFLCILFYISNEFFQRFYGISSNKFWLIYRCRVKYFCKSIFHTVFSTESADLFRVYAVLYRINTNRACSTKNIAFFSSFCDSKIEHSLFRETKSFQR